MTSIDTIDLETDPRDGDLHDDVNATGMVSSTSAAACGEILEKPSGAEALVLAEARQG